MSAPDRRARVDELRRARPRSRLLRWSAAGLFALGALAWMSGDIAVGDLFTERRLANLQRFLERDAMPSPIRKDGFTWERLGTWLGGVLTDRGFAGMLATLWISIVAACLAGLIASAIAPLGARTLSTRSPFPPPNGGAPPDRGRPWRLLNASARGACVLLRAIPEYVWAFLLLAMLGPNAWPVVLALAIHNGGILGRLGADTIENLDSGPLRSLSTLGGGRRQIAATAVVPLALPRFLLYFFYRFETCVREATVLGMLGVVSLGYWILDARARQRYDEMLVLVALGAILVLIADLVSYVARWMVRRA